MFIFTILFLSVAPLIIDAQYRTCPKLWKKMGCRTDLHHNLTLLIDDRTKGIINWDSVPAYELDLLCRCRQAAVAGGYKWFAADSHGLCAAKLGDLASYLREFPLDGASKCSGLMAQVPVQVPGGSCIDGRYRPFFYTIETSVPGSPSASAPAASAPAEAEEEIEEEVEAKPPQQEVVKCTTVADVVLVVDVSGSIKASGFLQTKNFIKKFMDRFDFTNGTRIGIITYDEACRQILNWTESSQMSKADIREYCDKLIYTGGSTSSDLALGCAKDNIVKNQKRAGVPITVVILTDGNTWGGSSTVKAPADNLRSLGCKVIAVGVGPDIDEGELETIAETKDNVILKDDYSEITGPGFLNSLLAKSCR